MRAGLTSGGSATLWLVAAIAAVAAFQLWALMHVLRQNGRLLLRIEALEKGGGGQAQAALTGLPVNSEAPAFNLKDLDGKTVTLEALGRGGKPIVLMFSEPGCGACETAMPEVAQWLRDYADRLLIVPVSRGDAQLNRVKTLKYGIGNMLLQADREVAQAYLAEGTPSAVIVSDGRISTPLAVGVEAIRGLVAHAVLPASVKKGDAVPSLKLADLDGKIVDMAELRARRTLLLFWSPSCGFCQQMLEDVKAWESQPPTGAPELLIISAGSADDVRKQGFRSRVVLDPYYGASQVFNSGGTPSAVLLEGGRVASVVGVGAPEVLTLARSFAAVGA